MSRRSYIPLVLLAAAAVVPGRAQSPVILQRGVVNAVTLEPAPSRVAPGDVLLVRGINLGPAEGARAAGLPLPTELGGTRLLIANRPAALFSVSPSEVRAQVPRETPNGLVNVVVVRGEQRSRAAIVRIMAVAAGIKTKNGGGFGEAGVVDGNQLTLAVSGLGATDPAVADGELGLAAPVAPLRAYVGGRAAELNAQYGKTSVGESDVVLELPEGAKPGDVVSVLAGGAPVNRAMLGANSEATVHYLRLPQNARDVRAIRQSDLNPAWVMANGARAQDGCFPTWTFDFAANAVAAVGECLIAQPNAISPVVPGNETPVLAALAGPASEQPNTLSSNVIIFNPSQAERKVELPGPVANIGSLADGSLVAIGPGGQYLINPQTGDVREGGPGGGGGVAPGGGGGPLVGGPGGLTVDLGDGLNVVLSAPVGVGQGTAAVVVADSATVPTKAKLALIQGTAAPETRDLPAGWLPLLPPVTAAGGAGPGAGPGAGGGGGAAAAFRLPTFFDAATRSFYLLARNGAAQGLVVFSGPTLAAKELPFPEGWYAATCAPQFPINSLELSRRLALFGARRPEEEVRAICPAQGYLTVDLAAQTMAAVPLPGVGQVNTRAANGDVNDFLFASNTDPQNQAIADTLFVYDSVAGSPFRLDLPAGIVGFQQITPVPALNGLLATAIATRVAGDGGLVYFDLENEKTTVFPVPEGFQTVNLIGVFGTTRKILARGNKADGSQFLIYDLLTGDLLMPPNPAGVAWVGVLPAAAPGGGGGGGGQPPPPQQQQIQGQVVNLKANALAAIGYDSARAAAGILVLRIP
ncbi:MAG: hypothetical protein IT162_09795 [Bryobacterales bacterium]|nr:hypothetical protein [Bryobacterales bacterium]